MMTDQQKTIAEIYARWYKDPTLISPAEEVAKQAFQDVRFLLSELERLEREYAEERAAHNAHVTELIEKEEECRKLRELSA